ncbi:hypothetical protein HN51_020119 [Arachis hypogaea]
MTPSLCNQMLEVQESMLDFIRAYHLARGDHHHNVCIIPVSAHGTNPASATMCGIKIVFVGTDAKGNINIAELRKTAETHKDNLSALMVKSLRMQHINDQIFIPILAASNWTQWCLSLFVCGCIISWVFVYVKVPKTKGMPLEVIIEFFAIGAKPGADPATMAS